MLSAADIKSINSLINRANSIAVVSHQNPDGDAIGSSLALAYYLQQRRKKVTVYNPNLLPENFHFLDENRIFQQYSDARHIESLTAADAAFIVDISDWPRLGEIGARLQELPLETVCIDHHLRETPFADHDFIYPDASATGELIYELLSGLKAKLSQPILDCLLTAIMTDTGNFRFTNTSPHVLRVAADLVEAGARRKDIYTRIYESQEWPRVELLKRMLPTLESDADGRLAWMHVTQQMLKESGATLRHTEGMSDFPRTIAGVEVSILFMELPDGTVKMSFRSKGNYAVNGLAEQFSGGGHAFAAGGQKSGEMSAIIREVTLAAKKALFTGN